MDPDVLFLHGQLQEALMTNERLATMLNNIADILYNPHFCDEQKWEYIADELGLNIITTADAFSQAVADVQAECDRKVAQAEAAYAEYKRMAMENGSELRRLRAEMDQAPDDFRIHERPTLAPLTET